MGAEPVSDAQRVAFDRDGYLVIDPEIPDEIIEGILSDLEPRYVYEGNERIVKDGVVYSPGKSPRIKDAWRVSKNVKRTALAPRVHAILEALYDRKPLAFQTLNFRTGTQQPTHSDAMHFVPEDSKYMCGVWVALEDIDMDNGPLVYYPGSHKLPLTSAADLGFDARQDEFPSYHAYIAARNHQYEQYVRDLISEHGFAAEYGTLEKGEALIWSSNLLHGGAAHRDPSRTRHSQVTHYLFEGSLRVRTPMEAEGDVESWKELTFVA
jgi:ectoine hydroxylase-related dioxygenase (phytanoyl-CoA dioxygenase family)